MMRRPPWLRLSAALLSLCLGPALVGPPSLHACPIHDGQASAMAGMPGMAGMHGHGGGAHAEHGQPDRSPDRSHGCCTCVGTCAGAGAMPAPPVGDLVVLAREILPAHSFAVVPAPRRSAHLTLIPFGTAPPIA